MDTKGGLYLRTVQSSAGYLARVFSGNVSIWLFYVMVCSGTYVLHLRFINRTYQEELKVWIIGCSTSLPFLQCELPIADRHELG